MSVVLQVVSAAAEDGPASPPSPAREALADAIEARQQAQAAAVAAQRPVTICEALLAAADRAAAELDRLRAEPKRSSAMTAPTAASHRSAASRSAASASFRSATGRLGVEAATDLADYRQAIAAQSQVESPLRASQYCASTMWRAA
jgi:hypothetical protein